MPLQGREWRPREIVNLLYNAGWTHVNNLCLMTATTGAESAFYQQAYHWNENGTTDWGLFQLNDGLKGGSEPGPGGVVQDPTQEAFRNMAWDPQRAVLKARRLYEERGFQPWAAYTSGRYLQYMPQACVGVANFLAVLNRLKPVV